MIPLPYKRFNGVEEVAREYAKRLASILAEGGKQESTSEGIAV